MKRLTLLVSVLLLASLSMEAQEKQPSWIVRTVGGILKSVRTPKAHYDSTYVFQTKLVWTIALEAERLRPSVDLSTDFSAYHPVIEDFFLLNGNLKMVLQDQPCYKVGLAAGYGTWRLGYGLRLGKKDGKKDSYFGFGINSAAYGGQIRYYKLHPNPTGTLIYDSGDPISLTSNLPGELKVLSFDAFYAFNRHRYVNNAAYTGRHLQRRSAGSWLVQAKYLMGDFSLNPDDPIISRVLGDYRFSTRQVSVGGGYGFNWVLFHQDPVDDQNGGLRNLTLNATALPMVSFLNLVRAGEVKDGSLDAKYKNMPTFTPYVRGAVCYSLDRWSVSVESFFGHYGFRGSETKINLPAADMEAHVTTRGAFHDFTVKAKLNLHF